MPTITLNTYINAEVEIVFDLSRSVDLHQISTKSTNEKIIAGKKHGLIGCHESVTWRAKHLGFYQELTSKITSYERPHNFTDEMQKGIFKYMKHQHIFASENGVTRMTDIFRYKAPLGFLGTIAEMLFLNAYLTTFLQKRNVTIKEYAEGSSEVLTQILN